MMSDEAWFLEGDALRAIEAIVRRHVPPCLAVFGFATKRLSASQRDAADRVRCRRTLTQSVLDLLGDSNPTTSRTGGGANASLRPERNHLRHELVDRDTTVGGLAPIIDSVWHVTVGNESRTMRPGRLEDGDDIQALEDEVVAFVATWT